MSEETTTEEAPVTETTPTETVTAEATPSKAFVDSMLDSLTNEDLKSDKMWERLKGKDADEFGQYVKELKSFSGKKGDIPKPDAPSEEWDAFHQKLGRPETVDGYDFGLSEEFKQIVGEGQTAFYEQALGMFKEGMFKNGQSVEGAESFFNDYLGMIVEQTEAISKASEDRKAEADTVLKNEWGDNRDGIETGIKAMLRDKGGMSNDDVAEMENLGMLKDPKLAIALAKISSKFDDDPELGSFIASTSAGMEEERMTLETQMMDEKGKYGAIRQETKEKWMRVVEKISNNS